MQLALFEPPKSLITTFNGDSKLILPYLIDKGVQVDSIITDPPYELGFMGKSWDKTGIAYDVELWELCLKVLKPGGHLLAFGGSRTYHRMACAIEDAGFEIRDQIMWIYGQGFPKSLNISKAIDKMAGAERELIQRTRFDGKSSGIGEAQGWKNSSPTMLMSSKEPITDTAKQWDGWGSALKPAHEPIVMARKPLSEKNIALNVLEHGTGGINIDGCRIEAIGYTTGGKYSQSFGGSNRPEHIRLDGSQGRFPANLIHDGSEEVMEEFAKYGERKSGGDIRKGTGGKGEAFLNAIPNEFGQSYKDTGSAARFFYSAKASSKDRNGSKHPTVKPISLIRYLCRLVTPPGGYILDPFAGSGTTGQGAQEEGFNAVLIEKEYEYYNDIKLRCYGE